MELSEEVSMLPHYYIYNGNQISRTSAYVNQIAIIFYIVGLSKEGHLKRNLKYMEL